MLIEKPFDRYAEAEAAITNSYYNQSNNFDSLITEYGDQAAFTLLLLAKIASKTERQQRAMEAFKQALKLNPFLWSCFESLCNMGESPNPLSVFQLSDLENLSQCHGSYSFNGLENLVTVNTTPMQDNSFMCTPQQNAGTNGNNGSTSRNHEETPRGQQLCLSGLNFLPATNYKVSRLKFDVSNMVSYRK